MRDALVRYRPLRILLDPLPTISYISWFDISAALSCVCSPIPVGYDPVRGPGSSCLGPRASGNCVVPWLNGTKNVSSVALVANGLKFARYLHAQNSRRLIAIIQFHVYGPHLHNSGPSS